MPVEPCDRVVQVAEIAATSAYPVLGFIPPRPPQQRPVVPSARIALTGAAHGASASGGINIDGSAPRRAASCQAGTTTR
jgi:hypothetical protein